MSSSQELTHHSIYLRKEQKRETRGSSPALKLKKKNDIVKNIVHALFAHTHTSVAFLYLLMSLERERKKGKTFCF